MSRPASQPESGHIHVDASAPDALPTHDPAACARWWRGLGKNTPTAWLHNEVGRRMQQRLDWIKLHPRDWLHAQPSIGGWETHAAIAQRYPRAVAHIQEPSAVRLQLSRHQLDAGWLRRAWPWGKQMRWLGPQQAIEPVDMIWANMQLHLHHDPATLLRQWHQALRVDGFVMFSCLGPDAALELHQLYAAMGWPVAGSNWTDMHDWGDMLVRLGYAEPVMDSERIQLSYATPQDLVAELRTLGRNLHPQRWAALRGRGWAQRLTRAIEQHWPRRDNQGRYLLTFEIIYGHALRAPDRLKVEAESRISLGEMKKMLRPTQN
jgi:malonyl-CoA O-methyltransferase